MQADQRGGSRGRGRAREGRSRGRGRAREGRSRGRGRAREGKSRGRGQGTGGQIWGLGQGTGGEIRGPGQGMGGEIWGPGFQALRRRFCWYPVLRGNTTRSRMLWTRHVGDSCSRVILRRINSSHLELHPLFALCISVSRKAPHSSVCGPQIPLYPRGNLTQLHISSPMLDGTSSLWHPSTDTVRKTIQLHSLSAGLLAARPGTEPKEPVPSGAGSKLLALANCARALQN